MHDTQEKQVADELERLAEVAAEVIYAKQYVPLAASWGRTAVAWPHVITEVRAACITKARPIVEAILSALREREPVAWRVVWRNGQPDFRKTEAGARALVRRFPDHEGKVQPLYTAPTPQEEQS